MNLGSFDPSSVNLHDAPKNSAPMPRFRFRIDRLMKVNEEAQALPNHVQSVPVRGYYS